MGSTTRNYNELVIAIIFIQLSYIVIHIMF